ncbi:MULTISPECIES: XRE family transcriptional regulator [Spirulina sp. CCY15215]|uniref:XRE family transcriptional regulator n=1 Tax=Spirulina sp. CCY15215 TaxID=2767591 RepID=UPI00194E0AF4
MPKNLSDIIANFPPERQNKIKKRSEQLIAEYRILQDIQKARKLTREHLSDSLGISQDSLDQLEEQTDLFLSTLRNYVREMGGSLQLIAKFPDCPSVELTGLLDREDT